MSADEPTGWCHIPVDLLHPWNVPSDLRSYGVVFAQKGPLQTLLHSGVREGICLNNDQLKHLQALLRYPLPGKGEGHGKEGGVIKRDRAEALVRFLFPHASKEEQWDMVCGILGRKWRHLDSSASSVHSADILSAFNTLPQEDLRDFEILAAVAADEELLKERRDRKTRAEVDKKEKQHVTPTELKDLHPAVAGCRISRHPVLRRYQVFYTTYKESGASG